MKIIKSNIEYILISIIMIFSILNNYNAMFIDNIYNNNYIKQIIFYLLGFVILISFNKVNIKTFFKYHYIYYLISIILLVLVLFLGSDINGARAWFNFGFISFQPSELAKLTLAITLYKVTYNYKLDNSTSEFKYILYITLLTFIPSILVFIEPDTGAIIFYLIILLTTLIYSGIKKIWFILFFICFSLFIGLFVYLYNYMQDTLINIIGTSFFYRVDRLINFSDNYQINNALTLLGSTTLFGSGIGNVSLYVPEAPTDFMYVFNFGNFGLFGGLLVTTLYLLVSITLVKKANNLFAYMFIIMFLFSSLYNIFMNIGLLPIMGIPLPFLSYGGSSLLIYFMFIAISNKLNNYLYVG